MTTIWKFPLERSKRSVVAMPGGARPLHVAIQDGRLCVWALVDPAPEAGQ